MKQFLFSSFIILFAASALAQPTAGLVAYWPMNGNYQDSGPFAIHGTNFGATATTNSKNLANSAMAFSNPTSVVSQYGTHPVNANLNFSAAQNFTISCAFYINSPWVHTGGFYENNMNYNGYGVWIWNTGGPTIQFNFRNNSVASTIQPVGAWRHLAAVRNGATLSIYINGILNATGTVGTQTPTYNFPGRFGTMFYDGIAPPQYNGLHGKLDEVLIYNRALTNNEILALASTALPVKLASFIGINTGNNISLNWKTEYEQNSSHYIIQRSNDGVNFTDEGRVNAAGNSQLPLNYNYSDMLSPGLKMHASVFYRLKSVDIDGSFSLSHTVAIQLDRSDIGLLVSPNPAKDILQVQTGTAIAGKTRMIISDGMGRIMFNREMVLQPGSNSIPVNIALFNAGVYFVKLENAGKTQVKQFIKE